MTDERETPKRVAARRIVQAIINDMNDRRGLHLDDIDAVTRREIVKTWRELAFREIVKEEQK